MISCEVSVIDTVVPRLARFGDERNQSRILNYVLARIGRRYRDFMRKGYLAGQMLNGNAGDDPLNKRILVYKVRRQRNVYRVGEKGKKTDQATNIRLANIFEHAGGYTIKLRPDRKRKALFFVGPSGQWVFTKAPVRGQARPFFSKSFAAFPWASTITAEADFVIEREIRKEGLS